MLDQDHVAACEQECAGGRPDDLIGLREHQQAWEAFALRAVRVIPALKAQLAAVTEETERSAMELMSHLRVLASSGSVASEADRAASLSKVVMAMQFQDITRQKLEHVGQALDHWRSHLQALLKGPGDDEAKRQLVELERIEMTHTMEEERRLHVAALTTEYQEPVPTDIVEPEREPDSVTLF